MIPNNEINNLKTNETALVLKESQSLIIKTKIRKVLIISLKSVLYALFLIIANIVT